MKSLDKKKTGWRKITADDLKRGIDLSKSIYGFKVIETKSNKKKPKELDWEKEFDKNVNYDEAETGCNWGEEDIKDFIKRLLTTQRQQILEEIKTRVDTWGGFEDDGGNLCHYDSEILEWVNDLLNKKDETN